mgnify:CR=1 FL=1
MKIKYVFVALFLFIIATPFLLNMAVNGAKENLILETENRLAANFKPLEKFRISKVKLFFDDFDKFLQDRLISRDVVVNLFRYFTTNNFKLFLDNPLFIEGKDNFVFLDKFDFALERHVKGTSSKNKKEFEKRFNIVLDKLKNISDLSIKNNIDFFVFVAPDKHGVYCKKLPDYLGKEVCSISKEITNSQIKKLAEHKHLYYKTDTHWNILGAEQAFYILMNQISDYKNINFIPSKNYSLIEYENKEVGDIRGMGLSNYYSFSEPSYKFRSKDNKILWKIGTQKNYEEKNLECIYSIANQKKESMINLVADNGARVLLIHDSFGTNLSYFFNLNFKYVTYLSYYENNIIDIENIINEFNPDLIIYETVERNF